MAKMVLFRDVKRGGMFVSDLETTEKLRYMKLESEYEIAKANNALANVVCLEGGWLGYFPDNVSVEVSEERK